MKRLNTIIRYGLTQSPLRFNLLLTAVLVWLAYRYIHTASVPEGSYKTLLLLLAKLAAWLLASLLILALLTTFIAWLRYRYLAARGKAGFRLELLPAATEDGGLHMRPALEYAQRPFLGFISGRLRLEHYGWSEPFVLSSTLWQSGRLRIRELYGNNELFFRDIREYQITGVQLYFEDMFRLLRLPIAHSWQAHFYHSPERQPVSAPEISPQAAEDMDLRIEHMRKVEGEYLNYKQFAYGDDVRRIVWKIYGRNRELVVRHPEIRNPYASESYLYASFYRHLSPAIPDNGLLDEMLNVYKQAAWSLYVALNAPREVSVRYVSEQPGRVPEQDRPVAEQVQRQIAQSVWQHERPLLEYIDLDKGSVFCIHSLSDPDAVAQLLEQLAPDQYVHFVALSAAFKPDNRSWLRRIFMQQTDTVRLQRNARWALSPLHRQVRKNEALLRSLLRQYGYASS